MSLLVLDFILNNMRIWSSENEKRQLYNELVNYFGIVGAVNECKILEDAWRDPFYRYEIENFIKSWLRKRRKETIEIYR
ncbi:MAG: hypothetical protein NO483_06335 [Candidatus Methanomethylicia archaeon]|nr:hypothetical protein [Candidatus Methanomethylicia archaeon]